MPIMLDARVIETFCAFLRLGLTAFGGPIAHLQYFRREFVERRGWIDASRYAHLLALCQSLPGPASSQMVFGLGLQRAGWSGAIAAFIGFTLPSAALMLLFAYMLPQLSGLWAAAALHALKLVAVCVVAQGVCQMARVLTPDLPRALIALLAMTWVLATQAVWMALPVVALGALLGLLVCHDEATPVAERFALPYGRRAGAGLLLSYVLLLLASLLPNAWLPAAWVPIAAFYRAGALVFGGGHVVLPLLQQAVVAPGWIAQSDFLAAYGAAQMLPGPMFSVAAYLGAHLVNGMGAALNAMLCLCAIFLPGLLLLSGALPFWQALAHVRNAARALAGVNAAVVGLLAAALVNPLCSNALLGAGDILIAVVGLALLLRGAPTLVVISWCFIATACLTIP